MSVVNGGRAAHTQSVFQRDRYERGQEDKGHKDDSSQSEAIGLERSGIGCSANITGKNPLDLDRTNGTLVTTWPLPGYNACTVALDETITVCLSS